MHGRNILSDRLKSRVSRFSICRIIPVLIFIAGTLSPLSAQSLPAAVESISHRTDLSGEWKISPDDRKEYAEITFDDTSWETVKIPGSLTAFTREKKSPISGTVWLRKKFTVNPSLNGNDLGLILGRIGTADETYVNGSCIGGMGKFPPGENSMWNYPRHYQIPSRLINYNGNNVIAVRVYYYFFGEILGTLALTSPSDMRDDQSISIFSRVVSGYVIIAMGLPIVLIFLLLYILRREDEYLFYLLQICFFFLIVHEACAVRNIFPTNLIRIKVFFFAWTALNVVHPVFLHRFYKLQRKRIERVLWGFLILVTVMLLRTTGKTTEMTPIIIFILILIAIGFYNLSCHISALYLKKPFARIFSFFGVSVVLGAIHDGLVYLVKVADITINIGPYLFRDYFIFHYTATLLYIGTTLVLVYRFVNMTWEVELLNSGLEKKVEERTVQLSDALNELGNKNSMLVELSVRDSLTGLYNHAAIFDRLNEILDSAWRHQYPVSLIMMDIDFFKKFNDTYGHQAGDSIILAVAGVLKKVPHEQGLNIDKEEIPGNIHEIMRDSDIAGRYGGDEFMLVLPYCDRDGAVKSAERVMERIRNILVPGRPEIKITGSFGLTTADSVDLRPDASRMIEIADNAMYASKTAGRDRITWYEYTPRQM